MHQENEIETDLNDYNFSREVGRQFLQQNGLDQFIALGDKEELPPKWDDLARLYKLVRTRKPFQVLEFGSGFSTIVMAYALKQNWEQYLKIVASKQASNAIRKCQHEKPGIVSIETSEKWSQNTRRKVESSDLSDFVEIAFSTVSIAEYSGQICHFYDALPDVVPDFVYLDGPDPSAVQGSLNGLSFQNPKRTVMSGDILKYESTLLPGFFMIVDGRTNNSRFLQRMLRRPYQVQHHQDADVTIFELQEPRLGKKNIWGVEAYSGEGGSLSGSKSC